MRDCKIIVIGQTNTGKTSLVKKFAGLNPNENECPTIGATFLTVSNKNKGNTRLCIWDTAGQERFRSLVSMYTKNISGCLIVGDISDPDCLKHMEEWHNYLLKSSNVMIDDGHRNHKPLLWFIGNKSDLCEKINDVKLALDTEFSDIGKVFISSIYDDDSVETIKSNIFQEMENFENFNEDRDNHTLLLGDDLEPKNRNRQCVEKCSI